MGPSMENNKENHKGMIDGFKEAVFNIWLRDGQNTWPIDINSIAHLFMNVFADELLSDINGLKEKGLSDRRIAALFRTSARIIRLIMPVVLGMKGPGLRIPIEKQREHVLCLLSLVKHLKHGDMFNRDGKNAVFSPEAFERTIDASKMIPADRKNSMIVHKLCGILWTYAETVCFKVHGLIREFHGPYAFPGNKDNEEILIRDFNCLNPVELWDECKNVPYKSIRVVTAYQGLDMTIDIYNNVSIKEGAGYIGGLRSYYVEADGKALGPEEIDRLCTTLSDVMISVAAHVETLDWKQLAEKYAAIFWFSKKELRDELQSDWHLPPPVKKQIQNGEISTRLQDLSPQALQRMLRIAF